MGNSSGEIGDKLLAQYGDLLPLLNYLKARIKYDTVRWIRTFGAKDDLIFSTRIKSFERTFDKLVRKGVDLSKNSSLLNIILSGERLLDDMVGVRFVCFEPHQIARLVSHYVTTERVLISHAEFYASSMLDESNPVHRFLRATGFVGHTKSGREYEDVSFVLRFSHPIDRYFASGTIPYTSPDAKRETSATSEKLNRLHSLFQDLVDRAPNLIRVIQDFPIECQIVTATQHIYNRAQRPLYEHIIQKKSPQPISLYVDVDNIEEALKLLKMNLLAADRSALSIHTKMGAEFEFTPLVTPTAQYDLVGRLPSDVMNINNALLEVNNRLLPRLFGADTHRHRMDALDSIVAVIGDINKSIDARALSEGDIVGGDLLDMNDPPDHLEHAYVFFWSIQRIVLLVVSNILLFSNNGYVNEKLRDLVDSRQTRGGAARAQQMKLAAENLVLERIFEKLKHTDHAISVLLGKSNGVKKWRDGYFDRSIFSDPLVSWRYATFMYKNREYLGAQREVRVGLETYDVLESRRTSGATLAFKLPEKVLFNRRLVEYEICFEMTRLHYGSSSVAGILELANLVAAKAGAWIPMLESVNRTSADLVEQARALCYEVLIHICVVSVGGVKARRRLADELGDYADRLARVERAVAERNEIRLKTWWLLCKAAVTPTGGEFLQRFGDRIKTIRHHPVEKIRFELMCGELVKLWIEKPPTGDTVAGRLRPEDFTLNAMDAVGLEIERLRGSERLSGEVQKLTDVVAEALREIRTSNEIKESFKDGWRRRLADVAVDGAEKIAVETIVAGLRRLLGFDFP